MWLFIQPQLPGRVHTDKARHEQTQKRRLADCCDSQISDFPQRRVADDGTVGAQREEHDYGGRNAGSHPKDEKTLPGNPVYCHVVQQQADKRGHRGNRGVDAENQPRTQISFGAESFPHRIKKSLIAHRPRIIRIATV